MAGLDSVLAATLARRLDSLLGLGPGAATSNPASAVAGASPVGDATSTHAELTTQTSAGAQGVGNAQANAAGRAPTAAQQTTLSAAARTIDTILRLAPASPGPVQTTAPVWPAAPGTGAPALAPLVAAALKETLSTSGLFYESHLAQWASGSRSFEQLQAEPQLKWPIEANLAARLMAAGADATLPGPGPLATLLGPAGAEGAQAAGTPPTQSAWNAGAADGGLHASANLPNTATALAHAASVAHTTGTVLPTGHEADASASALGLSAIGDASSTNAAANANAHGAATAALAAAVAGAPPESVTLLRQQLEMLVNPQFQWSGQAWPGAPMQWQVEERQGQSYPGELAPPTTWHTHLRLTLPTLGTVDVTLGLSGQQLQAKVLADTPASASQLADHGEDLRARLAAVGLIASQLSFGAWGVEGEVPPAGGQEIALPEAVDPSWQGDDV